MTRWPWLLRKWKDYVNRSVEESGRSCNDEDHDDHDKMTLMATEMEWDYVNRSEESSRSCNNEDYDDYDKMALMTMEMEWVYANRSVEESSRSCNNEDHDGYWRDIPNDYENGKNTALKESNLQFFRIYRDIAQVIVR